jgi:signal transduction histidine kinase
MRRLWVQLSLLIGALLLAVGVVISGAFYLHILVEREVLTSVSEGDLPEHLTDLTYDLFALVALLGGVGLGAGVITSRIVSAPVAELAATARRIGAGDLDARARVRGSQEMEELAQAFNTMAANLAHAEVLRSHLMADVSHELRTPLTALEGSLRAALDRVAPLDEAGIAALYIQTHHLIRLVNDLRELALAEAHQLHLEHQPVNLSALTCEVTQVFVPLAEDQGVRLSVAAPETTWIAGDAIRLRQVLDNLLSNALRYTPRGGTVLVSVERRYDHVRLAVSDSGEGLMPEQQAAVFDRFYRADPSRSRETGGSGLGLAIVKALIEMHGGTVAVASEGKGQGSTFWVDLPNTAGSEEGGNRTLL